MTRMGKTKPIADDETPLYRQFIEPPLIPGKPAFYRWIGYFDVDLGDVVQIVKQAREIVDPDSLRGIPDFDPDAIIPDLRARKGR
jgi:hypothetical protein